LKHGIRNSSKATRGRVPCDGWHQHRDPSIASFLTVYDLTVCRRDKTRANECALVTDGPALSRCWLRMRFAIAVPLVAITTHSDNGSSIRGRIETHRGSGFCPFPAIMNVLASCRLSGYRDSSIACHAGSSTKERERGRREWGFANLPFRHHIQDGVRP